MINSHAERRKFGQFLNNGLLYPLSFTDQSLLPSLEHWSRPPMYTYVPNFTQISLFCHHWEAKPPIFPHCQPWHPVVAPSSSVESRLNVCTQPQSFPYPTISKPFRSSNTFWTKSFSQALPFESVTDRQTDRQTHKKNNIFRSPSGMPSPILTKLGMMTEDSEHVLALLKRFGVRL